MTATLESDLEKLQQYFKLKQKRYDYAFHIQDPQNDVRFKIEEFYHPQAVDGTNLVTESVNKLKNVAEMLEKNEVDGAILIFIPTTNLINQTIQQIYQTYGTQTFLPLPLYSKVNPQLKNIVTDLNLEEINLVTLNSLYPDFDYHPYHASGTLRWKVIVASNIAEASVTFKNL